MKEKLLLEVFNNLFHSSYEELNVDRQHVPEWDSMKHAELIIKLQKTFKLKFKIQEVLEIKNLRDFLPLL